MQEGEEMCIRRKLGCVIIVFGLVFVAGCGTVEPTATPVPPTEIPPPQTTAAVATPTPTKKPVPMATPTPSEPTASSEISVNGSGGVIAFYSERDGNAEIYTMNPDGSDQRRLTFNQFDDICPVWSPDASQIAFISDREDPQPGECAPNCFFQIYVINADGSDEHKLAEIELTTYHPDWHPTGAKLSFDTGSSLQRDIYVVYADGSGQQLLIEEGFWADWSPDGTQIAFASNRDGNVEIYVADADGSNQRRLTENDRFDFFPAWASDGRRIAFATVEQEQIYIMDADGSNERQLTAQALSENPAWSPDGTEIVFQSNRDGNFEIYAVNVEDALQGRAGPRPRRLTNTRAGDFWPSWGPVVTSE
ncbi:MAG: DUF5050 domain-containing protein [Anaerolineae bacterium]|nr:DUF5050 domain-containing protein [Anaerolineae bacterium]NIN97995.1 DUF5050 domain-containing protein [Anaerolineae bacterium]